MIRHKEKPTVTAVLTAYRRRSNLAVQIAAIEAQTIPVDEILVWENGPGDDLAVGSKSPVTVASCSRNLGVWARFIFALNATTDFVWILDDDTIPGHFWVQNALETFEQCHGVIGSRGLRFHSRHSYLMYDEFGTNNPTDNLEQVDIVGHNWIFPRDWLSYFFLEFPNRHMSATAGEDIHLSYSVQKHLGLGTYVAPHPPNSLEMWGEIEDRSLFSGRDANAISSDLASLSKFENALSHYVKLGFRPISEGGVVSAITGKAVRRAPALSLYFAKKLRLRK